MWIIIANAVAAGIISGSGVVLAQMANSGTVGMPTKATWLVAGVTALGSACKDWQSHISIPPFGSKPS